MATTTPIYDALVAEQSFDPGTVTPRSTRTERKIAHSKWEHEARARVAAADLTKPKRPRKKAS